MSDFSIGEKLKVTLFGQSDGPAIGCVMEGFPAGQKIDGDFVAAFMARRAPGQNAWSTPRKEADQPEILSGLNADGLTCGAPITAVIRNSNTRSGDYEALKDVPRPGHADYTARVKYGNAWDGRGGGQFSARLTAPLCFAGALAKSYLEEKGIHIAAHIARIGRIEDAKPDAVNPSLPFYKPGAFPVLSLEQGEAMKREIEAAQNKGDSVSGAVECFITGLPAGLGGPYFGGLEGKLSQALFGIPAVKGLHFGDTQNFGSENIAQHLVGEEERVFGEAAVQQILSTVVMDAAVIDRESLTVADAEDVHGLALAFACPVMMNITAADNHILALVNIYRTVTAFIDI